MLGIGERSERLCAPRTVGYEHHGDHWVLRCSDRPDYHWGNALVLDAPPAADRLAAWAARHRDAFAGEEGVERVVIGWETAEPGEAPGLRAAAEAAGLELEVVDELALANARPREARVAVDVRPVPDEAWEELLALQDTRADDEAAGFRRWRYGHYRELVRHGRGAVWGAWRDGVLVGSAGAFWGDGLARFQDVGVSQAHRGVGICSRLVSAMTLDLADRAQTVLILVDRGTQAERIYRAIGYERRGTMWGISAPFTPNG